MMMMMMMMVFCLLLVMKKNNILQLQVDAGSDHRVGPKQSRSSGAKQNVYVGGVPSEYHLGGGASVSMEMMVLSSYSDSIRLGRIWIADNCLLYCFDGWISVHQMGSPLPGYTPACHHSTAVFAMWPSTTDRSCCPSRWACTAPWERRAAPTCRQSYSQLQVPGDGRVVTPVNLNIGSYLFCIVKHDFLFGFFSR